MEKNRLLIISNASLSTVDNNGKTLLSIIEGYPDFEISQLYFRGNNPEICEYKYYQLSDIDIIKGYFDEKKRGRAIDMSVAPKKELVSLGTSGNVRLNKNEYTQFIRECIWKNKWHSRQLDEWLEMISPQIIFFMGGDCIFAYDICDYIAKKYACDLFFYVTDDYVFSRTKEALIARVHRKFLKTRMKNTIEKSRRFFTICERMRTEYRNLFQKDSDILFNLTETLYDSVWSEESRRNDQIELMYAGSLYYGRDEVLFQIAEELEEYNNSSTCTKKAHLKIFSNSALGEAKKKKIEQFTCLDFLGSIGEQQLREELNKSNVLVFVESLDEEQIEKVRLSFSTKIPEYLSVGKPILAVGGRNTGSMDALDNVAICVYDKASMKKQVVKVISETNNWDEWSNKAKSAFEGLRNLIRKGQIFE